jgi:hypothetical protein
MTTTDLINGTAFDFDALDQASVMPTNKKQIIIDHILEHGIPAPGRDLQLFSENGTIIKDDFASYLGNKDFYSTGSFAKLANGTPLDFQYDISDGIKAELEKYKDRTAFDLGTFVHEAILEPAKWGEVVCEPKASRASHEGLDTLRAFWNQHSDAVKVLGCLPEGAKVADKKEWIDRAIELSGKRSIDDKNATIVRALHDRWMNYADGLWYNILASAHKEVSMYANDFMGLPMRVRPDGILFADQIGVNAIVSVKTTSKTTIDSYKRDMFSFGYDIKEAAYQRIVSHVTGKPFENTIMIVLSTAEPFNMGVFILSNNDMKAGFERFATAVDHAKFCIAANDFPGWEIKAEAGDMGLIDLTLYGS